MKKKKLFKTILTIFSVCLLTTVVILFGIIFIGKARGGTPGIFGYTFHVVATDSMTPEINVDDLVIAKKAALSDFEIGDDVVFVTDNPSLNSMTIVHRVVGINADGSLVTQGVKPGADEDLYPARNIVGKVAVVSTFWGKIFSGLTGNRNIVFGAALLVLLIIIIDEIVQISRTVGQKKAYKEREKEIREEIKKENDEMKE